MNKGGEQQSEKNGGRKNKKKKLNLALIHNHDSEQAKVEACPRQNNLTHLDAKHLSYQSQSLLCLLVLLVKMKSDHL